tara:strand:+ start:259 stop:756 length:498 start_codon:yes stop_codon:yes gene_type:complete
MSIYKQLLEVQKEVGAISKDSKNPFFKSKYFDINKLIEVVNPVLSKHGLVLLQPILEGKVYSRLIDAETGETLESYLELPNLPKPQDLGSCVSYYRRYTLASLMGLQATDEDGNGLKAKPKPKAPEKLTDDRFKDAITALKENKITKATILAFDLTEKQKEELNK